MMAVIEDWTEVRVAVDEYRQETAGYYPNLKRAKAAKLTGWYGAPPEYQTVKVIEIDGVLYRLERIKKGKIR